MNTLHRLSKAIKSTTQILQSRRAMASMLHVKYVVNNNVHNDVMCVYGKDMMDLPKLLNKHIAEYYTFGPKLLRYELYRSDELDETIQVIITDKLLKNGYDNLEHKDVRILDMNFYNSM